MTLEWLPMTFKYRGPDEVPGPGSSTAKEKVIFFHTPPLVDVTTTPLGRVKRVANSDVPGELETCVDFIMGSDETGGVAVSVVVPQPLMRRTLVKSPTDQILSNDVFIEDSSFRSDPFAIHL